jgi:hypothetical protein
MSLLFLEVLEQMRVVITNISEQQRPHLHHCRSLNSLSSHVTHAKVSIWVTQCSSGLSSALYQGRPSFNTRTLHVRFVVGVMALDYESFLSTLVYHLSIISQWSALILYHLNIIPLVICTHSLSSQHQTASDLHSFFIISASYATDLHSFFIISTSYR